MTAFTTRELEDALTRKLMINFGKTAEEAGETEMLRACALVLRDAMALRGGAFKKTRIISGCYPS